ncbi:hypothetical protein F5884DRAFT_794829 [Xylogone sp. PMI_703]|nr:hypothetical protein F5884DRAFT_794829 [Xylogone sp. PMI_703]
MKRRNSGDLLGAKKSSRPTVSCQLCRSKKLRCDRTQPCSNCTSRNVICLYTTYQDHNSEKLKYNGFPIIESTMPFLNSPPDTAKSSPPAGFNQSWESPNVLQRLERLERAVFSHNGSSVDNRSAPGSLTAYQNLPGTEKYGLNKIEPAVTPHRVVPLLGFSCSGPLKDDMSISQVPGFLPSQQRAIVLLDYYAQNIDWHYRILHVPSTRTLLENTYAHISNGKRAEPSSLSFLFSIFASSVFFDASTAIPMLNTYSPEVEHSYNLYKQLALFLLKFSEASEESLIPTPFLQTIGILTHLISHSEGFSTTFHLLRNTGLVLGRQNGFHLIDTVQSSAKRSSTADLINLEIQRRLWWHIVTCDWFLALMGGANEGTYSINPRQMKVEYPSNTDDEQIIYGKSYNLPPTAPTSMSAVIQRIRLAEICREIVDSVPLAFFDLKDIDYDKVLTMHAKLELFLKSLPPFFQIDNESILRSQNICDGRPYISWQRAMIHLSVHTWLCRLHRRFLLNGAPEYAISRTACVQSARLVLRLRDMMDGNIVSSRLASTVEYVLMAAVILAMDLCLNPTDRDAESQKAEIVHACKQLEKAEQGSVVRMKWIRNGIEALSSSLTKLKIRSHGKENYEGRENLSLHADIIDESQKPGKYMTPTPLPPSPKDQENNLTSVSEEPYMAEKWDQLWTDFFDLGPELDTPDWNDLLTDMELSLRPV